MLEKPLHPHEYAKKYREWEFDLEIIEQLLTCCCGSCAVCCIIRPFSLKAEFPNEIEKPKHPDELQTGWDEEYPEDEYYEDEQ
jgi:hypothetical protein